MIKLAGDQWYNTVKIRKYLCCSHEVISEEPY